MHPGTGTFSAIDLSITSSDLVSEFGWHVHNTFCGSDHYPIILDNDSSPEERIPHWNLKRADWGAFTLHCQEKLANPSFEDESIDPLTHFSNILISIADETIPKTSTAPFKPHLPWNNQECKEAIKALKKAERTFDRQPTADNLRLVRSVRAIETIRRIKEIRRTLWREFVSKLTARTPIAQGLKFYSKAEGQTY